MSKYSSTVIEKAPAAYWRLNDSNVLMVDAMGTYDGSYQNLPTFGLDTPIIGNDDGGSVGFNGSNEGATAACPPIATESFAVELWVKCESHDTGSSGAAAIELVGGSYPTHDTIVFEVQTNGTLRLLVRNTTSKQIDIYSTQTLTLGRWYHIMGIKLEGHTYLYINGVLAADGTGSTTIDLSNMDTVNIGYSGRPWEGQISEVAVYTGDRSVHDALQHYLISRYVGNNFAGEVYKSQPDLWYRLNDPVGSQYAKDEMSNDHGVYTNAPTLGQPSGLPADQKTLSTTFEASSSQYITLNGTGVKNYGTGDFSAGAWVKCPSTGVTQDICTNYNGSSTGWLLSVNSNDKFAIDGRWQSGNYQSFETTQVVADDQWHFCVMVHHGVTIELWVDGKLDSTHTALANGCNSTINMAIGTYGNSPQFYMNGDVHDFAFYNRRVMPDEILRQWQAGSPVAFEYDNVVLADYPIAYYKMDDSTVTMVDSSGYGYDGTHSGTTVLQPPGLVGSANSMLYNGTARSDMPVSTNLQTELFSVELWLNPNAGSMTGYHYCASQQQTDGVSGKFALAMGNYGPGGVDGHLRLWVQSVGSGWVGIDSDTAMVAGAWHHVVATYDGTYGKLYMNGKLVGQFTNVGNKISTDIITWGSYFGVGSDFDGFIDNAAYYNYPISMEQINRHYMKGLDTLVEKPKYDEFILEHNPLHYWRMDETGTTETDLVSGNDLSTTAGAVVRSEPKLAYTLNDSSGFTGIDEMNITVAPVLQTFWSVSYWVKMEDISALYHSIFDSVGAPGATGFIGFSYGRPVFGNGSPNTSDTDIDNQIVNVVLVNNNDTGTFYVNGVPDGSFPVSTTFEPKTLARNEGGNEPMTGKIQDIALFDFALSEREVLSLYLKAIMDGKFVAFGLTGNTKINGVDDQCTVRVYSRLTGELITQVLSDAVTGDYIIDNLDQNVDYDLLCFDGVGICPQASGPLQPVELEE